MDRDHEGHGGFTVNQINSSVAAWIQASPSDVILLWIGTNDFISGQTPSVTLNRLGVLLDTIHAARPSAKLVLATQPGVTPNNTFSVNPQDIVTYNQGMPALVNARAAAGWNIELLDLYTLAGLIKTSGSPDYASDGLHFSLTGYSKIANVWFSVLDPAVSSDTTPPTIPTGLSVTGTSLSTVSLTWNASVDTPAGVAVYKVYRNGVPLITTAVRTFQDTGLTANTTYSYGVTAIDFANNESQPAMVNATTGTLPPDVTPPGAPSGLSATAVSSTRIDLSWTGSTDPAPGGVSDGFNRANGGLGATWTPVDGTFQIVSQHVEPAVADSYTTARLTTWTGGDAQWAEATMTVTGPNSGGGPVVREGSGGDLYLVDYNARADHKLYSVVGGIGTVLGGWTTAGRERRCGSPGGHRDDDPGAGQWRGETVGHRYRRCRAGAPGFMRMPSRRPGAAGYVCGCVVVHNIDRSGGISRLPQWDAGDNDADDDVCEHGAPANDRLQLHGDGG